MICEICKKEITKNKRTISQNSYLHLVIGIFADELGYTHAEFKQLMKDQFGLYDEAVNKKTGEVFRVYHSTADMSRKDFAELTEKILIFANMYGIHIQTPDEYFETN